MNLLRTVFPTPKLLSLLPHCTISIQQLSTTADHTLISQQPEQPLTCSHTLNKPPLTSPSTLPMPTQILYKPNLPNFLNFSGIIQIPIQFHGTPDGNIIAATVIAQKDGPFIGNSSDSAMFPVVFEGDLAQSVACHVKPYDSVYVSGKLSLNPLPFVLSENQGEVYLIGNEINFVQGLGMQGSYPTQKNVENNYVVEQQVVDNDISTKVSTEKKSAPNVGLGCTTKGADVVLNAWWDLMKSPMNWYNYRGEKSIGSVKANFPDFRHKTNGNALWLNTAPNWVLAGLEGLKVGDVEETWKDLIENPHKWLDNRPTKKNVKAPDFIRKETDEGLWLHCSPKWVLAVLEGVKLGEKEDSWKDLIENPHKWWDNRLRKKNVKAPDFKHKETGESLWLNDSPKWVLSQLPC